MPLSEWPEHFKDAKDGEDWELFKFEQTMVVVATTDKAIGIGAACGEVDVWIPKSHLDDPEAYELGDELDDVTVTAWFARKLEEEFTE